MCKDGNRPAKSKHSLLKMWPAPKFVRNVVKFIGFVQFYFWFIPNFEMHVASLHTVCKQECTKPVAKHWTPEAEGAWEDLKDAILLDPCIQQFDVIS